MPGKLRDQKTGTQTALSAAAVKLRNIVVAIERPGINDGLVYRQSMWLPMSEGLTDIANMLNYKMKGGSSIVQREQMLYAIRKLSRGMRLRSFFGDGSIDPARAELLGKASELLIGAVPYIYDSVVSEAAATTGVALGHKYISIRLELEEARPAYPNSRAYLHSENELRTSKLEMSAKLLHTAAVNALDNAAIRLAALMAGNPP